MPKANETAVVSKRRRRYVNALAKAGNIFCFHDLDATFSQIGLMDSSSIRTVCPGKGDRYLATLCMFLN
jgi:hypothetical protein